MTQYTITVPRLDWLIGGSRIGGTYNTYYGSCGTDGEKGFYGKKLFNYRIGVERLDDETEVIKASVYGGYKSYDNTDESKIQTETFDLEQNSLPIIKAWLEQKCTEFLSE